MILITGAAGGIGRATALATAREGARVAVADLDFEGTQETASLIAEAGGTALALRADISVSSDVDAMVGAAVERLGRLDGAFNNAAVAQWQCGAASKKIGEISEEAFARIMQINVTGTWLCMRAELEHMRQHGGGAIVNASSVSGLVGRAGSGAYSASKHAINGLTKTAAVEYAATGIRVNAVCPGFIDTVFVKSSLATRGDALLASVPMGRLGQPEEVAELVVWLLSDRARYVTGSLQGVDGGFMAA
ncbi:glucose 1-dehydrogenase [Variovorax guangxiensis]|uniref:SDR family NAD(P)-dependent oxidoreductase n=1 Tax=Variovorax guangxiensis TaxID=1775474 RepID=UPI00285C8ECD|nr:glucose 1-dehydrogenase [Variovorax guangxiensis]MDR6854933.1 NAD(P)-dependent dehydrogenase (short-subunit alcohol dehydrogenase family) [Variovorax guangxiensis]